jgi:hypothetical protein
MVVYFVTAHEDDWQLFRGFTAWKDLQSPFTRGVFIAVTAGDGGSEDAAYWQARENAEACSIDECVVEDFQVQHDWAAINGHDIHRRKFINTSGVERAVLYSLRLPDGNHSGAGYPTHNCESIARLRNKEISSISSVDGTAVYTSWADLWGTLQTIMQAELTAAGGPVHPWVNANQYWEDPNACRQDHSDHLTVGAALKEFVAGTYNQYWWKSYETACPDFDANLSGQALEHKQEVYKKYTDKMDSAGYHQAATDWSEWGDKMYGTAINWAATNAPPVPPPIEIAQGC